MKQDTYIEIKSLAIGLETDEEKIQIIADTGAHVAYVEIDPLIEIAKEIVSRYNLHGELAKALQDILLHKDTSGLYDEIDYSQTMGIERNTSKEFDALIDRAKEVLTKAGLKY